MGALFSQATCGHSSGRKSREGKVPAKHIRLWGRETATVGETLIRLVAADCEAGYMSNRVHRNSDVLTVRKAQGLSPETWAFCFCAVICTRTKSERFVMFW